MSESTNTSENSYISHESSLSWDDSWKSIKPTTDLIEANSTFDDIIKFFRDIIILIIIVFAVRFFVVTPFQIKGNSMEDNYHNNEIIFVDIFSYLNFNTHFDEFIQDDSNGITRAFFEFLKKIPLHIGDPKRGDVVVIKPHVDTQREFYLKRIIGMPGETIKILNWKVFIKKAGATDFIELNETYLSSTNSGSTFLPPNITETEFLIPEGTYWTMGDNRIVSLDSRGCFKDACLHANSSHFLKRWDVVGKVLIDFWYFNMFQENNFPKLGELKWVHPPRFFNTPKTASYPELDEK